MEMTNKKKILAVTGLIVVLLVVYFIFDKKSDLGDGNILAGENVSTTTNVGGVSVESTGNGNYTIERVSVNGGQKITIPDLSKAPVINLTFDDATKKTIEERIIGIQNDLKKDPSSLAKWIDLGVYRKMAGDYKGALEAWKYITLVAPNDYVSLGNLGDLYAYYLKDNAMAEISYKKAIELAPNQVYLYVQLANVYKNVFGDVSKAKAIIGEALKKIPGDKTLIELRDSLN